MKFLARLFLFLVIALLPSLAHAQMVSQINGQGFTVTTGTTAFLCPIDSNRSSWVATEAQANCIMPVAGTFSNFHASLSGTSGAGSLVFTLMKNGLACVSGPVVTITNATSNSDDVNTCAYSAGDTINIQIVASGVLNAVDQYWGMKFTSSSNSQYPLMATTLTTTIATGAKKYMQVAGTATGTFSLANTQLVMPAAGTISALYVTLDTAPTSGHSTVVSLNVNGTNCALTTSIVDTANSNSDLTHSCSISVGDRISTEVDTTSSGAASRAHISMLFAPTTNGQFPLLGGTAGTQAQNLTRWITSAGLSSSNSTEARVQALYLAANITDIRAFTQANVGGSGQATTYNLNIAATPSALTCAIASGAQACSLTATTPIPIAGDTLIDTQIVTSATTGTITTTASMIMTMPTATPAATSTPTNTPTATPTSTPTSTPTLTPTPTPAGMNQVHLATLGAG